MLVVGAFFGGVRFEHGHKIANHTAAIAELEAEIVDLEEENVVLGRILRAANIDWEGSTKGHQRRQRVVHSGRP
jgi:hypothetical protein